MTANAPSALITGGSRGIGLGIATRLAAQGWALTLSARNADRLAAVRADLEALGAAAVRTVAGDTADDAVLDTVVARHEEAYGAMNALVLAAGVGSAGPLTGYPARRLDKQLAVNVRAPFLLVGRALPLLRAGARADPARGGRIIALASVEGVHPEEGLAAYGASKAALISLVRSVNAEEAGHGVTASAISPGYVDTDMSAWAADRVPTDKMITVADIVKVADLVLALSPTALVPHIVVNRVGAGAYRA